MAEIGQSVACNNSSARLIRTSIIRLRKALFSADSLRRSTTLAHHQILSHFGGGPNPLRIACQQAAHLLGQIIGFPGE
ncbi:Uncharacterised protein [Serratia fonticola]|uniref:Uncharacterized protein n=1 Tax=Serratia fonticola TaxID=47917 RepID=A0A4U9VIF7_SERFO|nr:Uncharacterised protein [Serratia fonticola]